MAAWWHLATAVTSMLAALVWAILPAVTTADVPRFSPGIPSFYDLDPGGGQISGTVEFPAAADEADITSYNVYFGISPTSPTLLLVVLPKTGMDPEYFIPMHTLVPTFSGKAATHILAFSANADGEDVSGSSVAFHDRAVPTHGPQSITFIDTDYSYLQIGGRVTVQRAIDEQNVTMYAIYIGTGPSSPSSLVTSIPVPSADSTDSIVHEFPLGYVIAVESTHLIAYTANIDGMTTSPSSIRLVDRAFPEHNATSIQFLDRDLAKGEISGDVSIGKASSEVIISHYSIYFSASSSGPAGQLVASLPATGDDLVYNIPPDTAVPAGMSYLLVLTSNAHAEMPVGSACHIVDRFIPVDRATGLSFLDEDLDGGEIAGTLTVSRAADETDITRYAVFFADMTLMPLGSPIFEWDRSSIGLNFSIADGTLVPGTAEYLLVLTGSEDGFMTHGLSEPLVDRALPRNPPASVQFIDEDTDAGQLSGHVTVSRSAVETDVAFYSVYYGSGGSAVESSKLNSLGTVSLGTLGSGIPEIIIAPNTLIPPGVTHILAFSGNAVGEVRVGVSTVLVDRTGDFPVATVTSVSFIDVDFTEGEIGGAVSWFEPSNNAGLLHYTVYLARDSSGANRQQVGTVVTVGTGIAHVEPDTVLGSFTHIIVHTNNFFGEGPGVATTIVDRALPVAQVSALVFTDLDPDINSVGGVLQWNIPSNPSRPSQFSSFVAYFSINSGGDNLQYIGEVPAGVSALSVPHGTELGTTNFSHLFVFAKNAVGEALVGVGVEIRDVFLPQVSVDNLNFFDQDLASGELGGEVGWTELAGAVAVGVTSYRVFLADSVVSFANRLMLGEVPFAVSKLLVPFDTPIGNWTWIVVVAANQVGEALVNSSLRIVDRTVQSCPARLTHSFRSSRWRVLAGTTSSPWRLRKVHFFEDSLCTVRLPTVPGGWPRRPRQAHGSPFANSAADRHLHDIFKPDDKAPKRNTTEGSWWSTGSSCVATDGNKTFGDPAIFGGSACYVGFSWESDTFVDVSGRVSGRKALVESTAKAVHCVIIEQAEEYGHFASNLVVQWYDMDRQQYRKLLEGRFSRGGECRMAYEAVLASECSDVN
eukprot:TRINITY_DN50319_c0_g1_i1.p1 TRINITY_DN50319_c0_g1~~TRINITY_DN50319_c0_g1_i1.p1  ORF type:complete len:1096 (-),score=159.74 TRINITY_DN50319_c0_g1_i1:25-3312(-)